MLKLMLISNLINDLKEGIKPVLMKLSEDPKNNESNKCWEKMRCTEQSVTIGVFIYKQ